MKSHVQSLFDSPQLYHLLQRMVGEQKNLPFLEHCDLNQYQSILEIGCGTGINAHLFEGRYYRGVDINPNYINQARAIHPNLSFEVADATQHCWPKNEFDLVFIHSVLHHLSDAQVRSVFERIVSYLQPDGVLYLTDLILPESVSISRILAKLDRGQYARTLSHWNKLLCQKFTIRRMEEFSIGFFGFTFWRLFYAELEVLR